MKHPPLDELEAVLGYRFNDRALLEQSVTHPSFAEEKRTGKDYQRLEFLGDTIVGVAISRALYLQHPDSPEGDLSKLRSRLVSSKVLAEVAREHGLGRFLRLGVGEERTHGRKKVRLLADMFEAICGAVLLDGGNDNAERVVMRLFGHRVEAMMSAGVARDYKSALQEFTQALAQGRPVYEVASIVGPAHEQTFEVDVRIEGVLVATGQGGSKKVAQQAAAQRALDALTTAADTATEAPLAPTDEDCP